LAKWKISHRDFWDSANQEPTPHLEQWLDASATSFAKLAKAIGKCKREVLPASAPYPIKPKGDFMEETYAILCHQASLERQLSMMRSNAALCIVAAERAYDDTIVEALQCLSRNRRTGIFVSGTRSYESACRYLEARGVDISHLIIIDAMTMELVYGDCAYEKASSGMIPESMGKISRAVSRGAEANAGSFVLFDSIEAFERYEDAAAARAFFSQVLSTLRSAHVTSVAISTPLPGAAVSTEKIYELFDFKIRVG